MAASYQRHKKLMVPVALMLCSALSAQLICPFVVAYVKNRFSLGAAHMYKASTDFSSFTNTAFPILHYKMKNI